MDLATLKQTLSVDEDYFDTYDIICDHLGKRWYIQAQGMFESQTLLVARSVNRIRYYKTIDSAYKTLVAADSALREKTVRVCQ